MSSRLVRSSQVEIFKYPTAASEIIRQVDDKGATRDQEAATSAEESYQQGYQAGEKAALEQAEAQLREVAERLARSIKEIGETRQNVIRELERELVQLALEIAKKLVQREVRIDEKIILTLVRVALERMGDASDLTLLVSPADYEVLREHLEQSTQAGSAPPWVLKTDPSMQRGDCRVESDSGSVDARIAEQFREIENGLLSEL